MQFLPSIYTNGQNDFNLSWRIVEWLIGNVTVKSAYDQIWIIKKIRKSGKQVKWSEISIFKEFKLLKLWIKMVLFLLFILIPSQVISIPNLINRENSKKFPINELKLMNLSDKEINKQQQHEISILNQQVNNKKHYYQIDNRFRRSSSDLLPLDDLELPAASNENILQSHDIITSSCDPNCLDDERFVGIAFF